MTDATESQACYAMPTLAQRFWRAVGFRYHLGDEPEGSENLAGWMRTDMHMRFGLARSLAHPRERQAVHCLDREHRHAVAIGLQEPDGLAYPFARGAVPMNRRKLLDDAAHHITKEFTDRGKLIEAGFALFAHYVMAKDAPAMQLQEMRLAYMAGAEHLFSSIMNILDPGEEPTDADLRRMDLIGKEIDEWRVKLSDRVQPAQGRA